MFSRQDQLLKKTGPDGVGRYDFLKQLINEFTTTRSFEAKKQTLANLANFAYDPINYDFIKQLHLTDLFLAQLTGTIEEFEATEELVGFAIGGIVNLCCDPELKEYIISKNGIHLISNFLLHKNPEISLNALGALYFLFESESTVPQPIHFEKIQLYVESDNPRLRNLGQTFLQTYRNNTKNV